MARELFRSAEEYETARRKLVKYFSVRRFPDPEDLADETIARALEKFSGGAELTSASEDPLMAFLHGFARFVALEETRKQRRRDLLAQRLKKLFKRLWRPNYDRKVYAAQCHDCLRRCLRRLPEDDCQLFVRYHKSDAGQRKALAEQLDVTSNALVLRVLRSRRELEKCVQECLTQQK